MPFVEVKGQRGRWKCCYKISTPMEASAERVVPNLPIIVFIHSHFCPKETFERQFDNPTLRQFNLVTFDLRAFGETGGHIPKSPWLPTDVTDDVHDILEALQLPPCHVFGLSLGSYTAVDLAARYPRRILSAIVCSPLSAVEPEDIADGRRQLFGYFEHYARPKAIAGAPDEAYADDIILGATQLMFNVLHTPLVHANLRLSLDYDIQNYTEEIYIHTLYEAQVGVFLNRKPFPDGHFATIRCPVAIIHPADDIAYPIQAADDLRQALAGGGVPVSLREVPGPHFACVTHPDEINLIIYETVVSNSPGDTSKFEQRRNNVRMETPFRHVLAKHGYHGHDTDSDSSDSDFEDDMD